MVFAPISPLAPRFDGYDSSPEYVLLGGLVFVKLTIPLIAEYISMSDEQRRDIGPRIADNVFDEGVKGWSSG